jgi:hypothetical protein
MVNRHYRLARRLETGLLGEIWEAVETRSRGRGVAVRFPVHADPAEADTARQIELAAAAVLHQNVTPLLDAGEWRGHRFVVTEWSDRTLRSWLDEHQNAGRAPALGEVLRLFDQIAAGIEAVHEAGLVCTTLVPSAVTIADGRDGEVAKVSRLELDSPGSGQRKPEWNLEAPAHAAPELAAGGDLVGGPESDVFALGAILVDMLCIRPWPSQRRLTWMDFVGVDPDALAEQVGRVIPAAVWREAQRALAQDPCDRHASVAAMRAALGAAWMPPRRVEVPADSPWAARWRRIVPWPMIAIGLLTMVGGGVLLDLGIEERSRQEQQCPVRACRYEMSESWESTSRQLDISGWLLCVGALAFVEGLVARHRLERVARTHGNRRKRRMTWWGGILLLGSGMALGRVGYLCADWCREARDSEGLIAYERPLPTGTHVCAEAKRGTSRRRVEAASNCDNLKALRFAEALAFTLGVVVGAFGWRLLRAGAGGGGYGPRTGTKGAGVRPVGKSVIVFIVIISGGFSFLPAARPKRSSAGPLSPKSTAHPSELPPVAPHPVPDPPPQAPRVSRPRWSAGETVNVEITLVPDDRNGLSCSASDEIAGKHCAFEAIDKAWSKGYTTDDKKLFKPYTTVGHVQFVAAGMWSQPELAPDRLPFKRFSVKCKYRVDRLLKNLAVRWRPTEQWYLQEEWYAGSVSDCKLVPPTQF